MKHALDLFHPVVREWFEATFAAPTKPQQLGWPAIARGESTLILAPTGSGKTLTAFLWCINRLVFVPPPGKQARCRILYVSPLKALAVDVERNLRGPLAGITSAARARGIEVTTPEIAIRTGDTPARERARFVREPADILITTPESLFLLLTSNARERLASVDTVIIDEIHALVPGKRGAHLTLSLERLEAIQQGAIQRLGLSATQRPLDEVARFLGGVEADSGRKARRKPPTRPKRWETAALDEVEAELHDEFAAREKTRAARRYRPVTIVNATEKKQLALRIEMPLESTFRSLRKLGTAPSEVEGRLKPEATPAPEATEVRLKPDTTYGAPGRTSIWSSVHPRLLELVRAHQSTLLFVNSRRLAERLAAALNDLAGEPLVRAHHGSVARDTRAEVEELLKAGLIKGLVATSSLELGIDMGAIDLVVQIEAPPSVASGLQRIGRSGHKAGAVSEGVIFPKFRGDLVACAAVSRAMREGRVEATRYPRNPLDVLAQQVVAIVAEDTWPVDRLFALVRGAAPFADLSSRVFEGVLDMLSGRYPSDDFAELRPRVTWDRTRNTVRGREGVKRVAIANAGTIPDRGLYGVFLAGADRPMRVGELDEEMVFESKVNDTFTLGASTWRIEEITHDRVLVSPAPGIPGKAPFWHADQAGRPVELGLAIGALVRELRAMPRPAAADRLMRQHDLENDAAEQLLRYLDDQAIAGAVPDDRTIVIERCLDEVGDWRVCVLSPLGSRIHAPWAMAVTAHIRSSTGLDVEVMWGDEGFVVRFPETDAPPDPRLLLPNPEEIEGLLLRQLGATSLFAARFRETAARALLLPRRRPGMRTPLWQQRKRAADLLAVAARFGSFPMLLETYRELLRDHFDVPALIDTLRRVEAHTLRVATIDSKTPSPFAASLLFNYVANYIYDGDAPLAERRAQALSVDQGQLRELLGDVELRELLDPGALVAVERRLQHLDEKYRVRSSDALHDLLIRIGDLSIEEIEARSVLADTRAAVAGLERDRRILPVRIGEDRRYIAAEDAARYRDALGTALPTGIAEALLEGVRDPLGDLTLRYARSRGPFAAPDFASRFALGAEEAEGVLFRLKEAGRILEGEFRPKGTGAEWVDPDVLRSLRHQSLAKLRRDIEPVETSALGRFLISWHGIGLRRRGSEALLDAIEQLQGTAVPASVLEREILPARVTDYQPALLDAVMAAGEVVWVGVEPLGERDGRVALYLTDQVARLRPPVVTGAREEIAGRARDIREFLRQRGASFFAAIHQDTGGGFPQETVDAIWELVWSGHVTNDTLHPLRAYGRVEDAPSTRRGSQPSPGFRSRRLIPASAEGRWSLVDGPRATRSAATEWAAAMAQQLLNRHGVVTRETVAAEALAGGFSAVYQALKAMEEHGRIRRGYFVTGLGAAQFAAPEALDSLRSLREPPSDAQTFALAATDPGNPYGSIVKWPELNTQEAHVDVGRRPTRTAGALVILVDGFAAGYLRRGERELLLFQGDAEPQRTRVGREVARTLLRIAASREEGRRGMLIAEINGMPAIIHPAAHLFVEEGFASTAMGLQARIHRTSAGAEGQEQPASRERGDVISRKDRRGAEGRGGAT